MTMLAADAGAEVDEHEVGLAASGAELPLRPGRGVGVVVDGDRHGDPPRQGVTQRLVAPRQVRRERDGGPVGGDEPRRPDAHGDDLAQLPARRPGRRARRPRPRWCSPRRPATSSGAGCRGERAPAPRRPGPTAPPATFVPPMSMPRASCVIARPPARRSSRSSRSWRRRIVQVVRVVAVGDRDVLDHGAAPGGRRGGPPRRDGGLSCHRWAAASRSVSVTAAARSASRSRVSGRTERTTRSTWHTGQTRQTSLPAPPRYRTRYARTSGRAPDRSPAGAVVVSGAAGSGGRLGSRPDRRAQERLQQPGRLLRHRPHRSRMRRVGGIRHRVVSRPPARRRGPPSSAARGSAGQSAGSGSKVTTSVPSTTRARRTTHRWSTAGRLRTRRWSPTATSSSASRRLRSTPSAATSGSGRVSR